MTGLIWKDLLVLRKTLRFYALFFGFYLLLGLLGLYDVTFVSTFLQVMLLILPLSLFSFDQASHWDRCAVSLPLSRRAIVGGRYLFVLLLALIVLALEGLMLVVFSLFFREQLDSALFNMLGGLVTGLVIPAILMPLNYKFGPERARIFLFVLVGLPSALIFLAYTSNRMLSRQLAQIPDSLVLAALLTLLLAAGLGMGLSYLISCHIYQNKEF